MISLLNDTTVIVLDDIAAKELYDELCELFPVGTKPKHWKLFELRQILQKQHGSWVDDAEGGSV